MSIWVEGDSYYAFGNSPARRVPVPALPAKNLPSHPYNLVILAILFRGREDGKTAKVQLPRETLFNEAKGWHVPASVTPPEDCELSPKRFPAFVHPGRVEAYL